MEGLTIRPATRADFDRIAAIIDDPPSKQSVAIVGDERRARAATRLFVRSGIAVQLENTVVAEVDGVVAAMMDASTKRVEFKPTPALYAKLLVPALRATGPVALLRFVRSRPAWDRVSFGPPPGDYYISELNVAAAHRNRGIGAALLRHAEQQARSLGCARMSLTTNIENPAQHLYERAGFRIVEKKLDAEYASYGGSEGRVFMVKPLD